MSLKEYNNIIIGLVMLSISIYITKGDLMWIYEFTPAIINAFLIIIAIVCAIKNKTSISKFIYVFAIIIVLAIAFLDLIHNIDFAPTKRIFYSSPINKELF